MRSVVACTLVVTLLFPAVSRASDHVVSAAELNGQLAAAAHARAADLATLEAVLVVPEVARAAARFGIRTGALSQAARSLTDAELHDFAVRARALRVDPVAGTNAMYMPSTGILVLILLVLIALVVALAYGVAAVVDD